MAASTVQPETAARSAANRQMVLLPIPASPSMTTARMPAEGTSKMASTARCACVRPTIADSTSEVWQHGHRESIPEIRDGVSEQGFGQRTVSSPTMPDMKCPAAPSLPCSGIGQANTQVPGFRSYAW